MPLAGLLFMAMALSAPVAQPSQPDQSLPAGQVSLSLADNGVMPVQSFQLAPSKPLDDNAMVPPEDICYKIRAYIFKRDDDHAPELIKSTTCGPRQPHAKDAVWPKGRVVPAN